MARRYKSRYESEVHLGFLAIAFLLVALNFVSNYALHQARLTQREESRIRLRRAAMVVSREIEAMPQQATDRATLVEIRDRNGLADLALLPDKSESGSMAERSVWLAAAARQYPPRDYPGLAERLDGAEPGQMNRGQAAEYYFVQPVSSAARSGLLVLAMDFPDLAYLEDAGRLLMFVLIAALVGVAVVYALLSRFMFLDTDLTQ